MHFHSSVHSFFRFNKLTLDTDESEDGATLVPTNKDGELHLEADAKTSDSLPMVPPLFDPAPKSSTTPPPLSFLNEMKEGEEKPAILKLLDTTHLQSSSFVMSSIKVLTVVIRTLLAKQKVS